VSADAPAPSRVKRWLREPLLHFLLAELALLAFNVGVEIGQHAFIAAVLGVFALAKRIKLATVIETYARPAAHYAMAFSRRSGCASGWRDSEYDIRSKWADLPKSAGRKVESGPD